MNDAMRKRLDGLVQRTDNLCGVAESAFDDLKKIQGALDGNETNGELLASVEMLLEAAEYSGKQAEDYIGVLCMFTGSIRDLLGIERPGN